MRVEGQIDLERLPESAHLRGLSDGRGRRFAAPIEQEFAAAHLRRARRRVRAWHTTILVVLLVAVIPGVLTAQSGDGPLSNRWNADNTGLLLTILIVSTLSRATLVFVAWSPWFERLYPRIALPLVAVCHGSWAFVCSGEILGTHPEYLAPLVTDVFAAYFFSGLLFRQALVVSVVSVASLVMGGWYFTGSLAPTVFTGLHLSINVTLAGIAGFAYECSSRDLFAEHSVLREMAALDGLTGLKNRRSFDEHLARLWRQAVRDGRRLAILMIDVDRFKHYNDRYGHQAGDLALQRIADTIKKVGRRPLDLAARYGGEELAVILYDPAPDHAVAIAEQLKADVAALAIEHDGSTAGCVTVSIGGAVVRPRQTRSPQGALQLADEALYEAKREGRNRVRVLEQEYETLSTGSFGQSSRPAEAPPGAA